MSVVGAQLKKKRHTHKFSEKKVLALLFSLISKTYRLDYYSDSYSLQTETITLSTCVNQGEVFFLCPQIKVSINSCMSRATNLIITVKINTL